MAAVSPYFRTKVTRWRDNTLSPGGASSSMVPAPGNGADDEGTACPTTTLSMHICTYDPATGAWEVLPRWGPLSRAATVGGKVHVMGGHDEGRNTFNVVECFDPATGAWEVVAPMGTARCSFGAAIRLLRLVCLLAPFGPDYPSTTGSGEHCIQQPECCSYAVDETGQVCAYVSFPPSLALVSDPCCLSSFQPARTHTQ